jgi:diacylglycerol kinase family enzyme
LQSHTLDIYRVKPLAWWEMVMMTVRVLLSIDYTTYRKKIRAFQSAELVLELLKNEEVDIDGELYLMPQGKHTFEVLPRCLTVRVPDGHTVAASVELAGERYAEGPVSR